MNAIFPAGNLDSWNFTITNYLPKATATITKTVDPVICAALLALTGKDDAFERSQGTYQFLYDKNTGLPTQLIATLVYDVPSFKVATATEEAVADDRAFVLAYLQQLKGIELKTVTLDISKGTLLVSLAVKVGYTND